MTSSSKPGGISKSCGAGVCVKAEAGTANRAAYVVVTISPPAAVCATTAPTAPIANQYEGRLAPAFVVLFLGFWRMIAIQPPIFMTAFAASLQFGLCAGAWLDCLGEEAVQCRLAPAGTHFRFHRANRGCPALTEHPHTIQRFRLTPVLKQVPNYWCPLQRSQYENENRSH
jgi:hypothetical protein